MPITQDRMKTLVDCADACYRAHEEFCARVDSLIQDIGSQRITPQDAWNSICSLRFSLRIPAQSLIALGEERKHFSKSQMQDNYRRAIKMQRMRRDRGIMPRPAPAPRPASHPPAIPALPPEMLDEIERMSRQRTGEPGDFQDLSFQRPAPPPVPRHRHLLEGYKISDEVELVIEPSTGAIEPKEFDPAALVAGSKHEALEYPDDGPTGADGDESGPE